MKIVILLTPLLYSSLLLSQTEKNAVLGDYDGNGKKEYAYTKINDCNDECDGKCETIIYFSDKNIKPLAIAPSRNGTLFNLKDLNNDGKDELGFYPDWCTSCWHPFYVYTLNKKKNWEPLLSPISTHCTQWDDGKIPIKKDPKKKGNVIITTSLWKDEDIKVISKSIKIK
ncbi:hypothetical protein D1631_09430 [Chryseobacterium nematophagum]|uniref:VCBS repeat-containing protein n=1 Tax=Chryseobacterium nematophagum TaxID=2305228 RepID=A0A3M7TGN3_9FLAO|nr:hypothetical protein [Chryseobacterium nematophagum]RNA62136.1 hypothetical protein D1631_09430 [Chryseobacterium nematophagum]